MVVVRQRRSRRTSLWQDVRRDLLVLAMVIVVGGWIVLPLFRTRPGYRQDLCVGNLLAIKMAARAYAADYDDTLPASHSWPRLLVGDYLTHEDALKCPEDKTDSGISYALNSRYGGTRIDEHPEPDSCMLFYDADPQGRSVPRHHGWTYCVCLDGSIGFVEQDPNGIGPKPDDASGEGPRVGAAVILENRAGASKDSEDADSEGLHGGRRGRSGSGATPWWRLGGGS